MSDLFQTLPFAFAAVFAGAGLLHLVAPNWLRRTYERWEYPRAFPLFVAAIDTLAAVLLASPDLRAWGIGLGEIIAFFSVVAILTNERKIYAVPAILLMAALISAALTIPHHDRYTYYTPPERAVMVSSR